MASLDQLRAAVRLRPNAAALRLLREHQETLAAMAMSEHDRIEATGLLILIEMAERVNAVMKSDA